MFHLCKLSPEGFDGPVDDISYYLVIERHDLCDLFVAKTLKKTQENSLLLSGRQLVHQLHEQLFPQTAPLKVNGR